MGPLVAIVGLQLLGGFLRANAAKRAAQAQAAQDRRNALIAEMAAGDAEQRGQTAEGEVKQATTERISSDQAKLAASGVDVKAGSALDVLAGQRTRGAFMALKVRGNAMREAWGYRTQADTFKYQAALADQAGNQAFTDAMLGGLLSAGGSIAGAPGGGGGGAGGGAGGAGVAYPVLRIGEPTTFERPSLGDYAPISPESAVS